MSYGEEGGRIGLQPERRREGAEARSNWAGLYAAIIDICNESRGGSGERPRLWSIAITEAQGAQMWAVKAATWKD